MRKYQCQVCGHIYDPKVGEPRQNIPPGTEFEDLPANWTCPECGAPKSMYRALSRS